MTSWPLYCTICLTSRCNAHCRHCSSNAGLRHRTELDRDRALGVVSELATGGTLIIGISGGEPLLVPWVFDVIAHARAEGLITGIGTNGSTISRETAKRLRDCDVSHVQVSIDGIGSTHDQFRGVPGLFDKAVDAIELLASSGVRVNVCMTVCRFNAAETEQVIDLAAGLGVTEFNLSQFVPVGRGNIELDLSPREWKAQMEYLWAARARHPGMRFTCHEAQVVLVDQTVKELPSFKGCQAGLGVSCIRSDGAVLPCVMLDLPVGNINRASFEQVWSSAPALKELRDRRLIRGRCGVCGHAPWCGGCRGVAYAYTGDYLAEDPHCWSQLPE